MRSLRLQCIPIDVEIGIRDRDSIDRDDLPLLQPLPRPHRSGFVLSAYSILPHRDAHCTDKVAQVLMQMGVAQDPQLGLSRRVPRCGCRIRKGARGRRQDVQALPE